MERKVPIEVSARHIHLSKKDLEALFGKRYRLKKLKILVQPGEFLAKEKLDIQIKSKKISKVSIVGPVREKTQIELAQTDAIFLGIKAPIRESGDIRRTPGAILINSGKKIRIKEGIINTWRHIHCNPKEAKKLNLKNGELVSVRTEGIASLTFHNVKVRVSENYCLSMHLDTDEGNAAGITRKGRGFLI